MLSKNLQSAINEQINKEFFSEYLYLSMAAHCYTINMEGFANYFLVQAQEEHFHGMKFFHFVNDLGGKVALRGIDAPKVDYKSLIEVFEETLAHEQVVTRSINDLMDVAIKERDHAVISFLKWFIDEQVEEESTVGKILHKLKLIGEDGHGLLMIDSELATKVFTPPAENA